MENEKLFDKMQKLFPKVFNNELETLKLQALDNSNTVHIKRQNNEVDINYYEKETDSHINIKFEIEEKSIKFLSSDYGTGIVKEHKEIKAISELILNIVSETDYKEIESNFFATGEKVEEDKKEFKKVKKSEPKKLFSQEQIAFANNVSILDLAQKYGLEVKKKGNEYHIDGQGGLVISHDGSKFNNFSTGVGGSAIQFVMAMENKSWKEAVQEIIGSDFEPLKNNFVPSGDKVKKEEYKNFSLPEKNENYRRMPSLPPSRPSFLPACLPTEP